MFGPVTITASDVHRAGGLVSAILDQDQERWGEVLAGDTSRGDPTGAYRTFCGMSGLTVALLNSVADLTGDTPQHVLARHVHAVASVSDAPGE